MLLVVVYMTPAPEPLEKECIQAYISIPTPMGRAVYGDTEFCGFDLEMSGIKGPSKLFKPGDPL